MKPEQIEYIVVHYWNGTDDIHPGLDGKMLACEQYIDMAKSFMAKS